MIPFVGIFFSFTNTGKPPPFRSHDDVYLTRLTLLSVGAALWAADIEAKHTAMTQTTAPSLREEIARSAE